MPRKTSLLATAMLLAIATAAAAQSTDPNTQNQPAQGSDAAVNQQSTTPAQTPTTPVDQQTTPADPSTTTSSELPKTASPLPLMGLGGLVSLAAGAWMTRSRRRA
jgi:LPXTG-motif cell wall-anchored protein